MLRLDDKCLECEFYLFPVGLVDVQILALLTRSRPRVSDTQVVVKACWSLDNLFSCASGSKLVKHINNN